MNMARAGLRKLKRSKVVAKLSRQALNSNDAFHLQQFDSVIYVTKMYSESMNRNL